MIRSWTCWSGSSRWGTWWRFSGQGWRRKPGTIRVDNGCEYISGTLLEWAGKHQITIRHIQPGQPQQTADIERHNRTVRHEWSEQYITETIEEAQDHATHWFRTCNNHRPNIGLAGMTPAQKLKLAASVLRMRALEKGGITESYPSMTTGPQ